MWRPLAYLMMSTSAAVLFTVVCLGAQTSVSQLPAITGDAHRGMIDRNMKGDRLPLVPGRTGENPAQREPTAKPKGDCVGSASRGPFGPEVPGRCVAFLPEIRGAG
jgi:hypothetical protein